MLSGNSWLEAVSAICPGNSSWKALNAIVHT
jgi:hypothetical protein